MTQYETAVIQALQGIRQAIEALIPEPEPIAEPDPPCAHPMEARADFGTTGGAPDWLCRACGYRTEPRAPA